MNKEIKSKKNILREIIIEAINEMLDGIPGTGAVDASEVKKTLNGKFTDEAQLISNWS